MTINWDEISGLRPNANTCHDDAEEFYGILMQNEVVKWDWLQGGREQAINQALACKSPWYGHVRDRDGDPPCMSLDEAVAAVDGAMAVRLVAKQLEQHLQAAVDAYDQGDLEECVAQLRYAANVESDYGDDSSTMDLACQLLYIGPWTLHIDAAGGAKVEVEFDKCPTPNEIAIACVDYVDTLPAAVGRVECNWGLTDPDGEWHDSGCEEVDCDDCPKP